MGASTDSAYAWETVHLLPGDRLMLYTDGITDAENAALAILALTG